MPDRPVSAALRDQVQILFSAGTVIGLSDRDLLERFLYPDHEASELAFKVLVERHGPMVFRVCNQGLRDRHAAEDAFQVTFLVLARQARSIRKQDSLESWLFGVACRAAARIRMLEARRVTYERRRAIIRAHADPGAPDPPEPWPELHSEIARLPEKYRIPIVLCYLEGLTHDQAAQKLSWPVGTLKTRLARARDQLRRRLEARGWKLAPLLPVEHLLPPEITEVPRLQLDTTMHAATAVCGGAGAEGVIASRVLLITNGVMRIMQVRKLKVAAIGFFGLAAIGLSVIALAAQAPEKRQADSQTAPSSSPMSGPPPHAVLNLTGRTDKPVEWVNEIKSRLDCRVEKVLVDLGAKVKKRDPVLEVFSIELARQKDRFLADEDKWRAAKAALNRMTESIDRSKPPTDEFLTASNDVRSLSLSMDNSRALLEQCGLTEKEIASIRKEDYVQKAKLTIRSRDDGVVVKRDVVVGNYYTSNDILLAIDSVNETKITATVSPPDVGKVRVGQRVTLSFPFSRETSSARVEAITRDPESGKVTLETSIRDPGNRVEADMSVRLMIALEPVARSDDADLAFAEQKPELSLEARLTAVERKLDRLLADKHPESSNATTSPDAIARVAETERGQSQLLADAERTKLAQFLWSKMAEHRNKLERGAFVATGRRVMDYPAIREHADGAVVILGAFDYEKGLLRFDRSEPLSELVPRPAITSALADRWTGKLILTPEMTLDWSNRLGAAAIAGPRFYPALHNIAPFDARSLGLLFWNRDSSVLDFVTVLKTWTDSRLEEVVKESEHIYRITVSSGKNNAIIRTLWLDDSRGFTPTRCEIASFSAPPIYVTELSWVEIHGIWVPKKYHNERYDGSLSDTYDLSFKWTSVNKPVPQSMFTVAGLDLEEGTQVIETRQGKPKTTEVIKRPSTPKPR
jgi:RNA polymerase sigma factor (sigma-70 family)